MLRMTAFPPAGHCSVHDSIGPLTRPPTVLVVGRQHLDDETQVDGAPACRLGLYALAVTERETSRETSK